MCQEQPKKKRKVTEHHKDTWYKVTKEWKDTKKSNMKESLLAWFAMNSLQDAQRVLDPNLKLMVMKAFRNLWKLEFIKDHVAFDC